MLTQPTSGPPIQSSASVKETARRPGGGLGWARLANGTFVNPADGGCDGSVKAIEKWKAWLAAGYTSSADAQKSK